MNYHHQYKMCQIFMHLKKCKLTILHGPMYMDLDDYPPYTDEFLDIFETKINFSIRCCHGYPDSSENYGIITMIDKKSWNVFQNTIPGAL